MKWRENLFMKAVAFMTAVAAFTATAMMSWYQLANFEVLWNDAYSEHYGYTSSFLISQDYPAVRFLVDLKERDAAGDELSLVERRSLESCEQEYSAENTNLRWQLLAEDGSVIYGNSQEKMVVGAGGYWYGYTRGRADISAGWDNWMEASRSALNQAEYDGECRSDQWQIYLPNLVDTAANMEAQEQTAPDVRIQAGFDGVELGMNTALTDSGGSAVVLMVRTPNGLYAYAPTVQACLTSNLFGYRFNAETLEWELVEDKTGPTEEANLVLWVDQALQVDDQYKHAAEKLAQWQAAREGYLAATVVLGVGGVLLMVYLCCAAGHKRGVDGIYLNWFHRIPGDVLLSLMFLGGVGALGVGIILTLDAYGDAPMSVQLLSIGLSMASTAALGMGALVTVCARCKAHTLLRNTWTWAICAWCWHKLCQLFGVIGRIAQALPLVWKVVLGCMAYTLFTIPRFTYGAGLWLLVTIAVSAYLCLWAYQWKKIRRGTQEIIGGNPNYHIDTRRMPPDLRGHADELNNLGHAISAAVEDRMKSERFKAELITNVSHDLKTPLTSIINYVDLLKKEDISDPKVAEYIEVLDRKSQRLKKLTEDLVEASKASTGNLTVNWERLDFKQLADQALAECGDRLEAQGLTVVRTLPEEPFWVEADGRHLWRVLDNLLSNCAKYALPGTRVYVDLRENGGWAVLSVKNISRDALDIPAERLMERFVRGDESRNASGSGLGLSIAQSLTELQRGTFDIRIDGDLFKAIVSLPLAGADGPGLPILRL